MSSCFLTCIKEDYLYIVDNFHTLCNEFYYVLFIKSSGKVLNLRSYDLYNLVLSSYSYLYDLLDNSEQVVFTDELFR